MKWSDLTLFPGTWMILEAGDAGVSGLAPNQAGLESLRSRDLCCSLVTRNFETKKRNTSGFGIIETHGIRLHFMDFLHEFDHSDMGF